MIKKIVNIQQQVVYQDLEAKRWYRRVVGGLGWPRAGEPGWLVVLGEDIKTDVGLMARELYLVHEAQAASIFEMQRLMTGVRAIFGCDRWLADREEKEDLALFRQPNQRLERPLHLHPARLAGVSLEVVYRQLAELLQPERKILQLGPSRAAEAIKALAREDFQRPVKELPLIAALGYAAGELVLTKGREDGQMPRVAGDWLVFDYPGNGARSN